MPGSAYHPADDVAPANPCPDPDCRAEMTFDNTTGEYLCLEGCWEGDPCAEDGCRGVTDWFAERQATDCPICHGEGVKREGRAA